MALNSRLGVSIYVGITQTGKTTKAWENLSADVAATGWPALIFDCGRTKNFRHMPHAESRDQVLELLYGKGTHAVYTPTSEEDVDYICRGIRGQRSDKSVLGRIHVLWDECAKYMSKSYISDDVSETLRYWAHYELSFHLVTQRPGHLHGDVYSTDPAAYVYRTKKVTDVERLEEEFLIKPDEVRALANYQFISVPRGSV